MRPVKKKKAKKKKEVVLRAVADSWWPRTYVVRAGRKVQGKLQLPALPLTGGTMVVEGERFTVAGAGLLRQGFRFVRSGQKVARAWGFFTWRIEHGDDLLTLRPIRFQDGRYELCRGKYDVVGSISVSAGTPGWRARRATLRAPDDLGLSVSLFVLWVALFESGCLSVGGED